MASIHRSPRSPHGVWYAHYYRADGTRVARSTSTRDKGKAKIICDSWAAAESAIAEGSGTKERITEILNETLKRVGIQVVERIDAGVWLDDWLASKEQVSAATRLAYEQTIREFKAFLGEQGCRRRLESITEADIRGFVALLRSEGRSAGTINKIVRKYLSVPFEKARKLGKIRFNPVMVLDPEKVESIARHTFTPDQVASLVTVANRDWSGAILLAYGTGARLQDIANLTWTALDLETGVVTFTERKTGRKAVIGLHADFIDWIAAQSAPDDPKGFVFPSLANRSGAGRNGLSKAFERLMDLAGIASVEIRHGNTGKGRALRALSFHSFRHGAATAVFNAAALKEITRRVTNHATRGVVDRYIHDDIEAIRAATALVPRLPRRALAVTPYELPPGFLKAWEKHCLPDPFRTPSAIWCALRAWRKGEANTLWRLKNFEAELKSEDREFNEALQKALGSGDQPPEARLTAVSAAVEAFNILFDPEQVETIKANWPTKQAVIQLATSILKDAGQPGISKRHWSRVLYKIGLKDLPESPKGRPRKLVT